MRAPQKAIFIILILASCVGCDQVTKSAAQKHLTSSQPVYLLGDVLRFQHSRNKGAILGLGADLPDALRFWLLIVGVGIVLIGTLWFVWVSQEMSHPMGLLGGSMIVGGGFSNLIDRLLNDGKVVDFMNVGVGALRTGIFNLADVAIMTGTGLLLAWSVFFRGSEGQEGDDV